MRFKNYVAAALCVPLLTLAGAGTAIAGEIKGPPVDGFGSGDWTPVAGYIASSECAFSGLNAYHPAGNGFPEKQSAWPPVQSYGMFLKNGVEAYATPGEACRGNLGG